MIASLLADIRETVLPGREGQHGPLPPLLVSMTLVTGLVDAFSYLVLGHVILAVASGGGTPSARYRYALIVALGICMGIQNAAARAIAVPDLTTTVLIRHAQARDPLAIALAIIAAAAAATRLLGRSDPAWVRP